MSILQNLIIRFIGIMDLNSDRPHRPLNLVELTHSLLILLFRCSTLFSIHLPFLSELGFPTNSEVWDIGEKLGLNFFYSNTLREKKSKSKIKSKRVRVVSWKPYSNLQLSQRLRVSCIVDRPLQGIHQCFILTIGFGDLDLKSGSPHFDIILFISVTTMCLVFKVLSFYIVYFSSWLPGCGDYFCVCF